MWTNGMLPRLNCTYSLSFPQVTHASKSWNDCDACPSHACQPVVEVRMRCLHPSPLHSLPAGLLDGSKGYSKDGAVAIAANIEAWDVTV